MDDRLSPIPQFVAEGWNQARTSSKLALVGVFVFALTATAAVVTSDPSLRETMQRVWKEPEVREFLGKSLGNLNGRAVALITKS